MALAMCVPSWGAGASQDAEGRRSARLRDFGVRIVSPGPDAVLTGRIEIVAEVEADAPERVLFVEFEVDGRVLFSDARPPYELIWNTRSPAPHRIVVRAYGPTGRMVQDTLDTAAPPPGAIATFHSRVERVELFVRVEGDAARAHLGAEDFVVVEQGAEQPIVAVERSVDLPLAVGFMIDCSGSMVERLGFALDTAGSFIAGLMDRNQDKAFVMSFADLPSMLQEFTDDVDRLAGALELVNRGRYTKLYDAIVAATSQFEGHAGRRALVLLTDGHDAGSEADLEAAVAAAQRADVALYPVAVDLSTRHFRERWVLDRMALGTGGRVSSLHTLDDPSRIYEAIADDLRAQYRITYEPIVPGGDGEWRPIVVRLAAAADRDGSRLRARPGYFAE